MISASLAAGELHAALADLGLVTVPALPVLERADELLGMRKLGGPLDLGVTGG